MSLQLDPTRSPAGWTGVSFLRKIPRPDDFLASLALVLMVVIPLVEVLARPFHGSGIENAPLLVQHFGLILAMFGAVAAERSGHLTSLGVGFAGSRNPAVVSVARALSHGGSALISGMLAQASWAFVASEIDSGRELAYGLPVWVMQAAMPVGFLILAARLGARCSSATWTSLGLALALPAAGFAFAALLGDASLPLWPLVIALLAALLSGAPVFAILGGLALALFWSEGQPLAAVPLSHYQITVNPSLPALPLFTLAGLVFARSGAAGRLGRLFTAAFGGGPIGTAVAAACLCSFFTAFTGGSGVTILALGGLLLPLLIKAGMTERKGIGLVTSASALGVLLLPSVPLIMYAIIARVPINDMFLAGLLPAAVMVVALLTLGGFLQGATHFSLSSSPSSSDHAQPGRVQQTISAAWSAKWEIMAPVLAIGSLLSGLVTPTESAALTAAYAIVSQVFIHHEIDGKNLLRCLSDCVKTIGGVMLILGMALGLTNFLIDAGIPDAAVEWANSILPNKLAFLIALNIFLLVAGAMMEIFAAIVVLVPLLLPVAMSYGIDPIHFGIIFIANMEMAFLCPPAGMNIYFASAMFAKPFKEIALSVLRPLLAMFAGTLLISFLPELSLWIPSLWANR